MAVNPKAPAQRAKAFRLRKALGAGQTLDAVDALWLDQYEEKERDQRSAAPTDFGASKSNREVSFQLKEEGQSMGTGSAAVTAAAAALAAKEEGRRLDSLTMHSVDALKEACAVYKDICLSLRERMEVLEATHVSMLEAVRDHFMARTEAEADLMQAQRDHENEDPTHALLAQLLGNQLKLPPRKKGAARPPTNGTAG